MSLLENTSQSWLLIFDNADNPNMDLSRFFPKGEKGSILITTRLIRSVMLQTVGEDCLERLNYGPAIELLLKASRIELTSQGSYEHDAREVVELLGCRPLAIVQAGVAISHGLCSLGEYRNVFLDHRQALLKCLPTQVRSEYEAGVYTSFEVSATYLKTRMDETAKDALQLLNFYAFMHTSDFPETALEEAWKNSKDKAVVSSSLLSSGEEDIKSLARWHVSHLPTFMQETQREKTFNTRLRTARSLLASMSFVTFDLARRTTSMHSMIHLWSRDRLQRPEERINAGLNGLSLLSLAMGYPFTEDSYAELSQLQPHMESIAHNVQESGSQKQLLHGLSMRDFRYASEAVAMLEEIVTIRTSSLRSEHPYLLTSQYELARTYLEIGEPFKAIALMESVVEAQARTLRTEHPSRLSSQQELAKAYLEVGELTKAIALLEPIVEIQALMIGIRETPCRK